MEWNNTIGRGVSYARSFESGVEIPCNESPS